jgi:HlyD family secretion protein
VNQTPPNDFLKPAEGGNFTRKWVWVALVSTLLLALLFLLPSGSPQQDRYLTEEAVLGNLVVTVTASGTLQPTRSVDVGSELSGTLVGVLVNDNDRVTLGQPLAHLDASKLEDAAAKSRAALAAAEASVRQMEATVAESRANLNRLRHVAQLSGGKVPSKTELETAEAAHLRAKANEASARAAVQQAKAALKTDETNINKAVIRSPINGVVLARKVEPGQTVVASMNTPVLFTIAEDLTKMELQVKVDEADVSSVQLGQPANFTVSAWAGRTFPATLERVGLGSTITDNVVTYKTVLSVANDDLALRPGMTASARIVTANRDNALLVPSAALRFTPPLTAPAPGGGIVSRLIPIPQIKKKLRQAIRTDTAQVWVLRNGQPLAVPVQTGTSNGRQTEIMGGEIKAGTPVIVEYQESER